MMVERKEEWIQTNSMHVHKNSFYKGILFFEISKLKQIVPSPKQALNNIVGFCHCGFKRWRDFNLVIMVHSFLLFFINSSPLEFVAIWQLSCRTGHLFTTKVFRWQLSFPHHHGSFPLHLITNLVPCLIIGSPNTRCAYYQVVDYIWSWKVV